MESSVASQLSLWTLFIQADIVVKIVMVGLLAQERSEERAKGGKE